MGNDGVVCVPPALLQKIGERERWRDMQREKGFGLLGREKTVKDLFREERNLI